MGTDVGAQQRFEASYRTHYAAVAGFVARRVTADAVDDAVAEVFTVAWRRRQEPKRSEVAWLLGVASNIVAAHYRTRARLPMLIDDAALAARSADSPQFEERAAASLHLLEALRRLTDADRETLLMVAWEGLSQTEAAEAIGCSDGAFRVRLARARKRFRALLDDDPEFTPQNGDGHAR